MEACQPTPAGTLPASPDSPVDGPDLELVPLPLLVAASDLLHLGHDAHAF
jgi:hypothetical protein